MGNNSELFQLNYDNHIFKNGWPKSLTYDNDISLSLYRYEITPKDLNIYTKQPIFTVHLSIDYLENNTLNPFVPAKAHVSFAYIEEKLQVFTYSLEHNTDEIPIDGMNYFAEMSVADYLDIYGYKNLSDEDKKKLTDVILEKYRP